MTQRMEVPLTEKGKTQRTREEKGYQKFSFGLTKFEVSIRHPNGDITQAAEYTGLEFKERLGLGTYI